MAFFHTCVNEGSDCGSSFEGRAQCFHFFYVGGEGVLADDTYDGCFLVVSTARPHRGFESAEVRFWRQDHKPKVKGFCLVVQS